MPHYDETVPQGLFDELIKGGWSVVERWCAEKRSESSTVEFKCMDQRPTDALPEESRWDVARTVCGFANGDGGVLVFGIDTEKSRSKEEPDVAKSIKPIRELSIVMSRLAPHLAQTVEPNVRGLRIESIAHPSEKDSGVIVIMVPPSVEGPYRVVNIKSPNYRERYFIRTVSETSQMPHSMLMAMFGRRPAPSLKLRFLYRAGNYLDLFVVNDGRGATDGVVVDLHFPDRDVSLGLELWTKLPGKRSDGTDAIRLLLAPSRTLAPGMEDLAATLQFNTGVTGVRHVRVEGALLGSYVAPRRFRGTVTLRAFSTTVTIPDDQGQGWDANAGFGALPPLPNW